MAERAPLPIAAVPEFAPIHGSFHPAESAYADILPTLPFPDIPLSPERNVSPFKKFVARHEAGHAITAFFLNVSVDYFSVIPNPSAGYAGITTLRFLPSDEYKLQIIAAAGSHYSPIGNGSDMEKIHSLRANGGMSAETAMSSANDYCSQLTHLEWEIVSEITAFKEIVYGSEIPDIIRRAKLEARYLENTNQIPLLTNDEEMFIATLQKQISTVDKAINSSPSAVSITEQTIYEEQEDGTIKKYKLRNGIKTDVEFFCKHCDAQDTHEANCIGKNAEKNLAKNNIIFLDESPQAA